MKKILLLALSILLIGANHTNAQMSKRWYSYNDYLAYSVPSVTMSYVNVPFWNTANSKGRYSGGSGFVYDTTNLISVGMSFAPRIDDWNDVATYGSTIKVKPTDAFTIDSVHIYGVYGRNNAKPLVRDTLRLAFVYGNGTSTTNLPTGTATTTGYGSVSFPLMMHDTVRNIAVKSSSVVTPAYVQSIVLSTGDTAGFFNRSFALSTPFTVPAGNNASMSMTFKSGDASFVPFDTIQYLSGAYKYGAFKPIIGFNSSGSSAAWAPYTATDTNVGYFITKPYGGWAGYYAPTWAWSSSGGASYLQYPAIDFHINCPTCELNDVITGTFSVCATSSVTLAHSAPGGTWASSNTTVATVGASSGSVMGIAAGTVTITYAVGGNKAYTTFTVHPLPTAGTITGPSALCLGSLTSLTTSGSGGAWSSSAPAVASVTSGVVSAVSLGTAIISYSATTVCGTAHATKPVTVNPLPDAGTLTGATSVCSGSSVTLSSTSPGGTWAATTGNVTVSSSGSVTGVTVGTDVIVYTVTNMCGTTATAQAMTVNPMPVVGTTSGFTSVCVGSSITLTNTEAGGTWAAGNANATVNTAGVVSGLSGGTVEITYTITNSCGSANTKTTITVLDCTTGISALNGPSGDVSIFPNPTSGSITVTSSTQVNSVVISNMIGQKVLSETFQAGKVTINLEQLPVGIYTIRANDSKVFKVTKQ